MPVLAYHIVYYKRDERGKVIKKDEYHATAKAIAFELADKYMREGYSVRMRIIPYDPATVVKMREKEEEQ